MAEGGADPERKAEVVLAERSKGRSVMMIGDGVNDAAALSAANIGVAVHGGAEASLSAADAFLRRPGLGPVVELVEGGHRAVGVIKRNLIVSLGYNVVTASLAIAGVINPLIAAVLMPISSLSVVTLSYRSRTF
jgi:Cu2+-exporting ATPase